MMTLESIEAELGEAALGTAKCVKIYGHATTKATKTAKIRPCEKPIIVWAPVEAASAGSEFTADTFARWLHSREEQDVGSGKAIECKGALRPCFEVTWVPAEKMLKPVGKNPLASSL